MATSQYVYCNMYDYNIDLVMIMPILQGYPDITSTYNEYVEVHKCKIIYIHSNFGHSRTH